MFLTTVVSLCSVEITQIWFETLVVVFLVVLNGFCRTFESGKLAFCFHILSIFFCLNFDYYLVYNCY